MDSEAGTRAAEAGTGAGAIAGVTGGDADAPAAIGAPTGLRSAYQAPPAAATPTSKASPIHAPFLRPATAGPVGSALARAAGEDGDEAASAAAGRGGLVERAVAGRITVASPNGGADRGADAGMPESNRPGGGFGVSGSGAGAVAIQPASGAPAGDGGTATSLVPQPLQNLAASRFSVLQIAHTTGMRRPPKSL
jgi:hypothetical protein